MREREKALLLEWLIKFGTDWVNNNQLQESEFLMEIGKLERMGYLQYQWVDEQSWSLNGAIKHRLSPKGLALLKEEA